MEINKINPWLAGITIIFAGSLLLYFEDYRSSEFISALASLTIFGGWVVLFVKIIKGTALDFKINEYPTWGSTPIGLRLRRLLTIVLLVGAMAGNIYFVSKLDAARRNDILENQPTQTAIAEVSGIQERRGRRSTSYYAIFEYTAGNKTITHAWYEKNESDFLVGQKFEIRYSVKYPEMFKIIGSVP
jgi:hypothetical protein